MTRPVIDRIKGCNLLPSLPTVALRLMDLVRNDAPVSEIAKVISADPAMSSRLLRTVNSSFYRRSHTISTVAHAITVLGVVSVKTIVLGFSLVANLKKHQSSGFDHLKYWRRSIYAATAARTLAQRLNLLQRDECFLAALLADIGILALDKSLADEYCQLQRPLISHAQLPAAEKAKLGITHAEASGVLAREWKLPALLGIPMACHHDPASAPDAFLKKLSLIVSIAGRCADVFVDDDAASAINDLRNQCQNEFSFSSADCDQLLSTICTQAREQAPLFEISVDDEIDLSAILAEANQTLVDLMLRSEQQAKLLEAQNQQLIAQVSTDPLTGLANRARFDQYLAQQFRKNIPLSLILLDLDGFKAINDSYGHQAGDAALISTGGLLSLALREGDLAARIGGDEFALILPRADTAVAAQIAGGICQAISGLTVPTPEMALRITVSAGVATRDVQRAFKDPGALMRAADASLYEAKAGGRNCARTFDSGERRVA
jgi:diguanylate cyclase (GGDEF)-like protein